MQQFARIGEQSELPDERDHLRQHRGDRCAADAPAEAVDEQRVEDRVDDYGVDRGVHRLARVSRRTQDGVQSQIHVRYDVAHQDDRHVVAGVADRRLACPEEVEDRVEEEQGDQSEAESDDEVEHHDVAQYVLCRGVVLLSEPHRDERGGADADERSERRGEVHQREGERQSRNGHRSDAQPDEDAVDHVVQRRGRHGDNGRYGVLDEQFADSFRSEFSGCSLDDCHKCDEMLAACRRPAAAGAT